jgi:hypothetical protein
MRVPSLARVGLSTSVALIIAIAPMTTAEAIDKSVVYQDTSRSDSTITILAAVLFVAGLLAGRTARPSAYAIKWIFGLVSVPLRNDPGFPTESAWK